jgi:Reprolysin family propeptide
MCALLQHGVFTTEEDEYFVEPLWTSSNDVKTGQLHVIYKRSDIKAAQSETHCHTSASRTVASNGQSVNGSQ